MIKQKIVIKDNPVQQKLLKYGTSGPSVEEARQAMMDAKETAHTTRGGDKVPAFIAGKQPPMSRTPVPTAGRVPVPQPAVNHSDFIDEDSPAVAAQPVAQPAARVAQAPATSTRQEYQGDGYTLTIFFDTSIRQWVAEIQLDADENGKPGVERFTAPSKDALMPLLAQGKANATAKIHKQNRALKEFQSGFKPDTWNHFWALANMSEEEAHALPEKVRFTTTDATQVVEINAFLSATPEFKCTPESFGKIEVFLKKNGGLPYTRKNLAWAFRELVAENQLQSAAPAPSAPVATPVAEAPAVVPAREPVRQPAVVEQPQPRKRFSSRSGIVPGQSSAASSSVLEEQSPAEKNERQAAKEMSLDELRKVAIPSLANAKPRKV